MTNTSEMTLLAIDEKDSIELSPLFANILNIIYIKLLKKHFSASNKIYIHASTYPYRAATFLITVFDSDYLIQLCYEKDKNSYAVLKLINKDQKILHEMYLNSFDIAAKFSTSEKFCDEIEELFCH